MTNRQFHIILKPEPEGGFTVVVPSLPGCVTYGETLQEAKEMASDAIKAYITSLKKHKESVPTDEMTLITTVSASYA